MRSVKSIVLFLLVTSNATAVRSQSLKFGFVTDTHIGSVNSAEDLHRTIHDINADSSHGRIFIVAPDRYMTSLDAKTGK